MVGRAAANEDDAFDFAQLRGRHVESAQLGRGLLRGEAPAHGIPHRRGLLVDFLEHVVRIVALGNFLRLEINPADLVVLAVASQRLDLKIVGPQHDNLKVLQIDDIARVVDQSQRVARQKVFALAHPEHQRTAPPRPDQQIRDIAVHHRNPVCPVHLAQGQTHRLDKMIRRGFAELDGVFADEMGQHLGVGFGLKNVPLTLQFGAELEVIFDDPVVHQHDASALVGMRVGVLASHGAVRGPAGMGDAAIAVHRFVDHQLRQVLDAANGFADLKRPVVAQSKPRGIIAAVFQTAQPVQKDGCRLGRTNITDNSAHKRSAILGHCAAGSNCGNHPKRGARQIAA